MEQENTRPDLERVEINGISLPTIVRIPDYVEPPDNEILDINFIKSLADAGGMNTEDD